MPTTAGRSRPGIVIHRVTAIDRRDTDRYWRIPMTRPARTLLDLAPGTAPDVLAQACHEAWVRHRVGVAHIEACIARNPTKKGAAKLRRALGADVTLSDLEKAFLALLERHGLPRPRTNIDVHGDKVDCYWPQHGLVVELHSYRFHATRQAFEADIARRRRSNHVAYSYGDVVERGARTAAEIAKLLEAAEQQR